MSKAVHYKHPKFGYPACGMGDKNLVKISEDLGQVTCKRCLQTVAGGRLPRGRPPSLDSMVKGRAAWSMPAEDWEWLKSQSNQSETLRQAIALYRQQLQAGSDE